jgi:hypothetical protein
LVGTCSKGLNLSDKKIYKFEHNLNALKLTDKTKS